MFKSLTKTPNAPRGIFAAEMPLPMTDEEITAGWLSEALGVSIKAFSITSVEHGTSSKVFLDLTFEDGENTDIPTKVCVKGGFNPVIHETVPEMMATYRREAEFYYHIAPLTNMLLPKTWFAGTDTVNGQGIFIMSNVADECTFGSPLEPWPASRVGRALQQLASLHAKTWSPKPWGARFDASCRPPVAKSLLDRERIQRGFEALWKHADSDEKFFSLIHGDNHVGNTLIANDGTPGFIDWQGLQYGPAILDLVYFLVGALSVEDRRKHEKLLVDGYLEALHKEGGPKLEREGVWDDYRRYAMQGFLWSMTPQTMQPDEIVFAMSERYSAALLDYQTLELLGV